MGSHNVGCITSSYAINMVFALILGFFIETAEAYYKWSLLGMMGFFIQEMLVKTIFFTLKLFVLQK